MLTPHFVRSSGLWLIGGALIGLGSGVTQGLFPVPPGSPEFNLRNTIVIVGHVLVLIGVLGLARSGAAGNGWLARVGLGITLLATIAFIPSELAIQARLALGELLLGICAPLQGLGFVLAGIAVLRAGQWRGWHRFAPLLCGLYPFDGGGVITLLRRLLCPDPSANTSSRSPLPRFSLPPATRPLPRLHPSQAQP